MYWSVQGPVWAAAAQDPQSDVGRFFSCKVAFEAVDAVYFGRCWGCAIAAFSRGTGVARRRKRRALGRAVFSLAALDALDGG